MSEQPIRTFKVYRLRNAKGEYASQKHLTFGEGYAPGSWETLAGLKGRVNKRRKRFEQCLPRAINQETRLYYVKGLEEFAGAEVVTVEVREYAVAAEPLADVMTRRTKR